MVHSSLRKLYVKLLKYGYKVLLCQVEEDSIHLVLNPNNPWYLPEALIVYKNIRVKRSGLFIDPHKRGRK